MTKDEALKLALEALEWSYGGEPMPTKELEAINAIRQVLAEPPNSTTDIVEPIGEIQADKMGAPFNATRVIPYFYTEPPPVGTKLYAAPIALYTKEQL